MDQARLGRVLGRGARLAARTALDAVDAATATPPKASQTSATPAVIKPAPRRPVRPPYAPRNLGPAVAAARAGVLAPLRSAARALWHELTGSFFALFALSFGVGVWHTRHNAFSSLPAERYRLYAFLALAVLFAWFAVSSFIRARRRSTP